MGTVIQVGNEFVAVVGGKPKPDWSGLQEEEEQPSPSPTASAVSPMRHRTASTGVGYLQRTTGLVPAFAVRPRADFGAFVEKVQRHLERTGMDTIAYVRDPNDPHRVVSCVTDHARFTPQTMRELLQDRFRMYDSYDMWNDDDAVRYLLASVSKKLRDRVRSNAQGEPFAQHFAELVAAVREAPPPSNRAKEAAPVPWGRAANRTEVLMAQIGAAKPSERSWHCIEETRTVVMPMVDELIACREFKHAVTRTLAWNLLAADRTDAQITNYKNAIYEFISAHEEGLRAIRTMRKRDKDEYMTNRQLMPKDLFEVAAGSCHHEQYNAPLWPLAGGDCAMSFQRVPYSATAPIAPNSGADSQAPSDALLQDMLSQYSDANERLTPNVEFGISRPTDHFEHVLPRAGGGEGSSSHSNSNDNKNKGKIGGGGEVKGEKDRAGTGPREAWRTIAPAPSDPRAKNVDGHAFFWCATCHRWSKTHGTETHGMKKGTRGRGKGSVKGVACG